MNYNWLRPFLFFFQHNNPNLKTDWGRPVKNKRRTPILIYFFRFFLEVLPGGYYKIKSGYYIYYYTIYYLLLTIYTILLYIYNIYIIHTTYYIYYSTIIKNPHKQTNLIKYILIYHKVVKFYIKLKHGKKPYTIPKGKNERLSYR